MRIRFVFQFAVLIALGISSSPVRSEEPKKLRFAEELDCFRGHSPGQFAKPNCEVTAQTVWDDRLINYKFNEFGLRDRDYPKNPSEDKLRILIMGPALDGFGLTEEEMPSRQLERALAKLDGKKKIEVINGSIPGFFAPTNALSSSVLKEAYNPDMVVYFQSGDYFAKDYVEESLAVRGEGGDRVKIKTPNTSTFMHRLSYAWHQTKAYWSLYKKAQDQRHEQALFIDPTVSSFFEISSRFGIGTRLVIALAPKKATNALMIRGLNRPLTFLINLITPEVAVPAKQLVRSMRSSNFPVVIVSPKFANPLGNNLRPKENAFALTPEGAAEWASSVAAALQEEIGTLGFGAERSIHIMQYRKFHRKRTHQ